MHVMLDNFFFCLVSTLLGFNATQIQGEQSQ